MRSPAGMLAVVCSIVGEEMAKVDEQRHTGRALGAEFFVGGGV